MTHDGMTEAQYLADMNITLIEMGLRPVANVAAASKPVVAGDPMAAAAESQLPSGSGNGASTYAKRGSLATDAQINFIISLTEQITGIRDSIEDVARQCFTKTEASAMIERLKPIADEARHERNNLRTAAPVGQERAAAETVTDGMYLREGIVYKVQIAKQGSGRLYAKTLGENGFEYTPGAMRLLRPGHRMSLEQAKEYGKLYGVCCACGRDLTDEGSIEAGIGPVCAKKF